MNLGLNFYYVVVVTFGGIYFNHHILCISIIISNILIKNFMFTFFFWNSILHYSFAIVIKYSRSSTDVWTWFSTVASPATAAASEGGGGAVEEKKTFTNYCNELFIWHFPTSFHLHHKMNGLNVTMAIMCVYMLNG